MDKAHKRPRHGAEGTRLHLPDQAPPDGRHHDGRAGHRRSRRAEGLPVGAGRRDMEGGAVGQSVTALGLVGRRLGLVAVEEGPQAGGRPGPHTGEGLPHRLRRGDTGRRGAARRHGAGAGQGASRAGGRRLPTLRQPRRGEIQGRAGSEAGRPQTRRDAAPRRPRPVRGAQRPGGARGRQPCGTRPARATRRPWWSGPAPGRSAHRQRESEGGALVGDTTAGSEAGDPLPRRPAAPPPPLRGPHAHGQVHSHAPPGHAQAEGKGGGQGRRTPSWS